MKTLQPHSNALFNAEPVRTALASIDATLAAWAQKAQPPAPPLTAEGAHRLARGARSHVSAILRACTGSANVDDFVDRIGLPVAVGLTLTSLSDDELTIWVAEHCGTFDGLSMKMSAGEPFEPESIGGQVALQISARSGQLRGEENRDGVDALVARKVTPTVATFITSSRARGEITDLELALVQPGGLLNPLKWFECGKR